MAKCKGCGAEIIWLETKNGKAMPCDEKKQTIITENGGNCDGIYPALGDLSEIQNL